MKKKKTPKKEVKQKDTRNDKDFFQAEWNDDTYIQRTIAKQGRVGGRKLG